MIQSSINQCGWVGDHKRRFFLFPLFPFRLGNTTQLTGSRCHVSLKHRRSRLLFWTLEGSECGASSKLNLECQKPTLHPYFTLLCSNALIAISPTKDLTPKIKGYSTSSVLIVRPNLNHQMNCEPYSDTTP